MPTRLVAGVAALVLVGVLVSGVLVPLGAGAPGPPTGTAEVAVERLPADEYRLERGRFGSGTYSLRGPPAVVEIAGVTGNPSLRLTVDVPELGTALTNEYHLAGRSGREELVPPTTEVSPKEVGRERYEATVAVWLRTDGEYRALAQERVTLRVVG